MNAGGAMDAASVRCADIVRAQGFCFVHADAMRSALQTLGSLDDWPAFAASWEGLAPDTYLAKTGRFRRRRHAVFAAIGSAATDEGFPVVEGMLSLVHLDNAAHQLAPMPNTAAELTVTATASAAADNE